MRISVNHEKYWKERKIDWTKAYFSTWNHPHRQMIMNFLRKFQWFSLFEIGCGAGENAARILTEFKGVSLGGCDINAEAIETAQKHIVGGHFKVSDIDDILMSDNSSDVVLSDMCLIYINPRKMGKVLAEVKRISRKRIIFCEFHSSSFWARLKLRMTSGYYAYDYRKLLERYGFYDIVIEKIPEELWPGGNPQKTFGYIITAKVTKRK